MNVIFVTVSNINDLKGKGIYPSLMRKLRDECHQLCDVSPSERGMGQKTSDKAYV